MPPKKVKSGNNTSPKKNNKANKVWYIEGASFKKSEREKFKLDKFKPMADIKFLNDVQKKNIDKRLRVDGRFDDNTIAWCFYIESPKVKDIITENFSENRFEDAVSQGKKYTLILKSGEEHKLFYLMSVVSEGVLTFDPAQLEASVDSASPSTGIVTAAPAPASAPAAPAPADPADPADPESAEEVAEGKGEGQKSSTSLFIAFLFFVVASPVILVVSQFLNIDLAANFANIANLMSMSPANIGFTLALSISAFMVLVLGLTTVIKNSSCCGCATSVSPAGPKVSSAFAADPVSRASASSVVAPGVYKKGYCC
jgi:hypothetical protein